MEITVHGTILFKGVNQVTIYNREITGEEVGLSGCYSAAPAAAACLPLAVTVSCLAASTALLALAAWPSAWHAQEGAGEARKFKFGF